MHEVKRSATIRKRSQNWVMPESSPPKETQRNGPCPWKDQRENENEAVLPKTSELA